MANTIPDIRQSFEGYFTELKDALHGGLLPDLEAATKVIEEAFQAGKKVFIAGNGGSAATASHMACDFQKTTLAYNHQNLPIRIKAIALSDNAALMTAWGNDVSYDVVFSEQLRNLADPGDAVIVISASGNSPNVLETLKAAKEMGLTSVALLGFEGGKAKDLCDNCVIVNSKNYGVIEDAHSIFMHMITAHLKSVVHAHN